MNGYTLLEMTATLALLATASTAVVPAAGRFRDRMEVLAAREEIVAALHRTRTEAVRAGAASLQLTAEGEIRISVGDSTALRSTVPRDGGVRLTLGRGRDQAEIPFNGLGLGVFANQTIELAAGSARTRLIISSYGRVRRE